MPDLTATIVSRLRTSGASRTRAVWLALALAVAAPAPQALAQAAAQPVTQPAATPPTPPTVDPKTVVLQKKVDTAAVGLPKPVRSLSPATSNYGVSIAVAGQSMQMTASTEVKKEGNSLIVTDRAKTPMGEATDVATLDATTLELQKRSVSQGPMSLSFEVKDGKATGEMKMGGDPKPIAVDLGGPLFADGPGAYQVVAALPLADGYTTSFRNLDMQSQKGKVVQLKVAGSESVTVPAGTFDTFRVELSSDDGQTTTIWVAKDSHRPVKFSSVVPRMNGAVVTSELQP